MAEANGIRGAGTIKGAAGKGDIRVSDMDKIGGTDLGQIEIEGRIYKPSVFFVLARGDLQYKGLGTLSNFVPKILSGALKRPF